MGIKMNLQEFFLSVWARFDKAFLVEDRWKLYLEGLGNTLLIALMATIIGVVLGIIFAVINYVNKKTGKLKPLSVIANIYITVVRGTPVVLQLMIMYFVVFVSWNFDVTVGGVELFDSSLLIGAITFGLNSAAYVAEITRAGFEAVDDGQREAGRSLGLSTAQTMWYIIIPQAMRNSLPPLFNEFITLVKETAIVGYLGVYDLGKIPGLIQSRTFDYLFPLMIAAVMYLAVVMILTAILRKLEKVLGKSDRRSHHAK
jgi:His/Glu/Gln/Arg/opine family amino acid ABC transporter permease subunit